MAKASAIKAYKLSLKGYQQRQIAAKLKKSESQISRDLAALKEQDEYQLGVMTVVTFLEWFERAAQFFNMQNSEYEDLKNTIEKIKIDNYLDAAERIKLTIAKIETIRRIKESQDKNMERIVYQAKEGQLIGAIQLMKDMLVPKARTVPKLKLVKEDEQEEKVVTRKAPKH